MVMEKRQKIIHNDYDGDDEKAKKTIYSDGDSDGDQPPATCQRNTREGRLVWIHHKAPKSLENYV